MPRHPLPYVVTATGATWLQALSLQPCRARGWGHSHPCQAAVLGAGCPGASRTPWAWVLKGSSTRCSAFSLLFLKGKLHLIKKEKERERKITLLLRTVPKSHAKSPETAQGAQEGWPQPCTTRSCLQTALARQQDWCSIPTSLGDAPTSPFASPCTSGIAMAPAGWSDVGRTPPCSIRGWSNHHWGAAKSMGQTSGEPGVVDPILLEQHWGSTAP